MRTIDELDLRIAKLQSPRADLHAGLFERLENRKWLVILCLVGVAFSGRIYQLGAASLAEDEANKVFALRAYDQGDITVNSEHPMVMKLLCFLSARTTGVWNRTVGGVSSFSVSDETSLRLPNAIFGALTVIPLTLLASALLGWRVGFLTGTLWAVGVTAICFNRIAKEDTLLVFFMVSGFYLYHRAKHLPESDVRGQERLYALAGAAFGLMIGSKYFPHYFGLNALYYTLVGYDSRNNRPLTRRMWGRYFGGLVLAFTVFNPSVFLPQTWRYIEKYVSEELLTHHGYVVMGKLFINDMAQTPGGNPWYFYLLFLAVKVPLPVLLAAAAGVFEIFRHRGEYPPSRGYLFLRMMLIFWLIPMSVIGTKFLRYSLSLMPFIYMAAALGIVVSWKSMARRIPRFAAWRPAAGVALAVTLAAFVVVAPAVSAWRSLPYPSLYLNSIGGARTGYYFPHDEFYDLGARESLKFIADTAPPGAQVATEIPGVAEYYLQEFNRPDIDVAIMSEPGFTLNGPAPLFVLLQPGRRYIENQVAYEFVERSFPVLQSSKYKGIAAATVYFGK
jgi:hypothetical protein